MSFREKSAWISLIAHGVVFGGYFLLLSSRWDEQSAQPHSIGLLAAAVVLFVVLAAALAIIVAILDPKEAAAPADEREQLISLKAERLASYTLSTGVVLLIGLLLLGWGSFLVANLLLAAMVAAELVKVSAQLLAFRRGA
jgi:hypothetical protein